MSLIIGLRNISSLAEVSDYEARIFINQHQIAGPFLVEGHTRSDGWEALVKRFADTLTVKPTTDHVPSRTTK